MEEQLFTARPVLPDDLDAVCLLPQNQNELYYMFPKAVFPLTREQVSAAIASRFDSTVITFQNQIIGFANFYKVETQESASIGNVIISESWRGKGAAQFLISTMIETARQKYSVSRIEISCFNENTAGLLFYSKLGFVPVSIERRTGVDEKPAALIHFQLHLD